MSLARNWPLSINRNKKQCSLTQRCNTHQNKFTLVTLLSYSENGNLGIFCSEAAVIVEVFPAK